ncbi:MAG: hypothetical protein R3254_01305 [Thiomicrorhabdus sp.]|nr:hypothetical protein [Thiomicrorhabdus sp.]
MLPSKPDILMLEKAKNQSEQSIRYSTLNMWFIVLLLCALFVVQTGFNRALADTSIQQPVWQHVVQTLPEDSGVFNRNLRQAVKAQLILPDIESSQLNPTANLPLAELNARLQLLDQALVKYIRVSESNTRFEQLKRLMPALYNIEERKLIEQLFKSHDVQVPRLRNSCSISILDKRITRLANGLIFNMKPLVRERRDYEADLLKAMSENGVEFSARPPDFLLDYYLQPNGHESESLWSFHAKIELLNKYEMPIVTVNERLTHTSQTRELAQIQSVQELAKLVTNQLKEFLIHSKTN